MKTLSDLSQHELEILELALSRLSESDYLPQHAAKMEETRWDLLRCVRSQQFATSHSPDGSWFGEPNYFTA